MVMTINFFNIMYVMHTCVGHLLEIYYMYCFPQESGESPNYLLRLHIMIIIVIITLIV